MCHDLKELEPRLEEKLKLLLFVGTHEYGAYMARAAALETEAGHLFHLPENYFPINRSGRPIHWFQGQLLRVQLKRCLKPLLPPER